MSDTNRLEKLRSALIDLMDSVRYSQSFFETDEKENEARERAEKRIEELKMLVSNISDLLSRLRWLDEATKQDLSRNIMNFVNAAVEQIKNRVENSLRDDLNEYKNAAEREKLKCIKSVEAFLAASPLPILDKVITLKHEQDSYSARIKYRAEGNIQYDFLLDPSKSEILKNGFTFSSLGIKLKLPVKLSKAWLKKEAEPVFEKFDEYLLDKAEASGNQLVASFINPETQSSVDLVFSKTDSDAFVTVEYIDAKGRVDITGQPSLSKHLDYDTLRDALRNLLVAIQKLEDSKLALAKLKMDEEDVLEKLDMYGFMLRVLKVIGPDIQKAKEAILAENPIIKERIKLLGDKAKPLVKLLEISEELITSSEWMNEK